MFTDSRGNDSFNLIRSKLFADILFEHLKSRGIDSLQIKAVGKGESEPRVAWLLGNEYLFKQPSNTNALQVTLDENYIRLICKKSKRLCETLYSNNNRFELVVVSWIKPKSSGVSENLTPVFEPGEYQSFSGFDVVYFEQIFTKHPAICIEFNHVNYANESIELAKKRMETFRQFLIDHQIDIRNLRFGEVYLSPPCNYEDCRSRIEGKVLSLDGDGDCD